ncbi:fumarylacetoacetate hydrolase family protein [Aspergillus saccharolyticus JOP 1030-1]|uniref:Fumarylacetoacetase n=1 Tax=Aspergillus saccharolyticus JOP 1030-1 TaxID=1450539 RepID=A0A318ZFT3_9EURO|nr:fumarylacetoacetate hydrolase [Aspergillus saccharolyticus JOP 1030-1]PYH46411.1 fumarylacetoacetate hydrolase [Aspergillus saccharolyticus JOP 1030-1]
MSSPEYSHHFSVQNLPFGIASSRTRPSPQCATRLHNTVVFLAELHEHGIFNSIADLPTGIFKSPTLNTFAALPRSTHTSVRHALQQALQKGLATLPAGSTADITEVEMHLPVSIPAYTDFCCSKEHNLNAGRAILGRETLPPCFYHIPIAYNGRASTICVSGTPVQRPRGHFVDKTITTHKEVVYAPSRALDYELELGIVIGNPVPVGQRLKAREAEEAGHVFGLVLLNDWSARDIQGLEMIPLGPLNGKNFATTISPWIVTLDALAPFRSPGPEPQRESVPPYLQDSGDYAYDVQLRVELEHTANKSVLGETNANELYWSLGQMCAHLTSTGCGLQTGEVLGTGTVSGAAEGEYGSLLEVTKGGTVAKKLGDGTERRFLEDGDVVTLTGWAGDGVGFGECRGQILAAEEEGWR